MMIHFARGQNMFRPQVQNSSLQKMIGQIQNTGLQKVVNQVNANAESKRKRDTVELSPKAKASLISNKTNKNNYSTSYQKYSSGMFTQKEWAENAISEQLNGIKTISDVVDYAKSKLKFTMSKIEELENYINGTSTHSDPNMTKELAETYLHNYKQSIQSDLKDYLENHIGAGTHLSNSKEFDELSGGLASKVIENQLDSITPEFLGLSDLSDNPNEIMEALENASKILNGMTEKIEKAYAEISGGKSFDEPASSSSIFNGNSSLDFFASQMEKSYRIIDTPLKFNGKTLNFDNINFIV